MGGVRLLHPDGSAQTITANNTQNRIKPNGIALDNNGYFIVAHLGDNDGGLLRMSPDGKVSTLLSHVNGHPLPPTNYVVKDAHNRLWFTVSTTKSPRALDYRKDAASGFIAVLLPGETDAHIVADGLGYTNECVIDTDNNTVFVNETFAQRTSRFDLSDDGRLSNKDIIAEYDNSTFPDGLCIDAEGNLWVTSIVSNRLIRVSPDGEQTLYFEDSDASHVDAAVSALNNNEMNASHLASVGNASTLNLSSMTFSGETLSTMVLGNLLGNSLYQCETNTTGKPMPHWQVSLGELEKYLND